MRPDDLMTLQAELKREIKQKRAELEAARMAVDPHRCQCGDSSVPISHVLDSDGRCETCDGEGSDIDSELLSNPDLVDSSDDEEEPAVEALSDDASQGTDEEKADHASPGSSSSFPTWSNEGAVETEFVPMPFKKWFTDHYADFTRVVKKAKVERPDVQGWMPSEAQAFMRTLGCLNNAGPSGAVVLNFVGRSVKSGRRKLRITVDSGAAESVIPIDAVGNYPKHIHLEPIFYQTASGEPIRNEGEQRLPVLSPGGKLMSMCFQACEVTKPLASVKRMQDAGHAVVFAPPGYGGSFIL